MSAIQRPRPDLAAMRRGREAALRQRRREARKRVREFEKWRRHGFDRDHRPDVLPTDADFRLARSSQ